MRSDRGKESVVIVESAVGARKATREMNESKNIVS